MGHRRGRARRRVLGERQPEGAAKRPCMMAQVPPYRSLSGPLFRVTLSLGPKVTWAAGQMPTQALMRVYMNHMPKQLTSKIISLPGRLHFCNVPAARALNWHWAQVLPGRFATCLGLHSLV